MKNSKKTNSFKLYISPYKLHLKNKLQPLSEGSLLAFDFGSELRGYSDFLPWPSFGEQKLSDQLKQIQTGHFSKRFLIAKQNAFLDAQARKKKRNLFFGLKIPSGHYLIEDLLSFNQLKNITDKQFQTVKVKLKTYKIPEQIEKIKALHSDLKNIKWRLDLNGQSWSPWKEKLSFIKKDLDFIEDPLETNFKKEEKKLFAGDWIPYPRFQIKIVKPSRDSFKDLLRGLAFSQWKRVVFTHSFDHPLGQVTSAFWAGSFYKYYPHFFETGAFTHNLFKTDSYHLSSGPNFIPPAGYGFGFSASLKKENWKRWL